MITSRITCPTMSNGRVVPHVQALGKEKETTDSTFSEALGAHALHVHYLQIVSS